MGKSEPEPVYSPYWQCCGLWLLAYPPSHVPLAMTLEQGRISHFQAGRAVNSEAPGTCDLNGFKFITFKSDQS